MSLSYPIVPRDCNLVFNTNEITDCHAFAYPDPPFLQNNYPTSRLSIQPFWVRIHTHIGKCMVADPDPHYFEMLDPNQHESEKLDPDPHNVKIEEL